MVEIISIQLSVELIDRTDERTHCSGFASLYVAQSGIVDAVVRSGHFFPVPAVFVGTFATFSGSSFEDYKTCGARGSGVDIAIV